MRYIAPIVPTSINGTVIFQGRKGGVRPESVDPLTLSAAGGYPADE
jgi:hypothetical protein